MKLIRFFVSMVLIALFPAASYAIGAAGDTEWTEGATVDVQLELSAAIDDDGHPRIRGVLTITNPSGTVLKIQKATNRQVLAFLIFDSLGNPVAPKLRGKSDPDFQILSLPSHASHMHQFESLDIVTGSAWLSYDLLRGQRYRVIAVYRPAGPNGPGFTSQEVKFQLPP